MMILMKAGLDKSVLAQGLLAGLGDVLGFAAGVTCAEGVTCADGFSPARRTCLGSSSRPEARGATFWPGRSRRGPPSRWRQLSPTLLARSPLRPDHGFHGPRRP
jgi:hypothetical protein